MSSPPIHIVLGRFDRLLHRHVPVEDGSLVHQLPVEVQSVRPHELRDAMEAHRNHPIR